jgi:hypothetical protein
MKSSKPDHEEAKRELTGNSDTGTNEEAIDSAPESERWDPLPGSMGHKVPATPSDDEDEEGRSDNERLVDDGIVDAEHDRSRQSASR